MTDQWSQSPQEYDEEYAFQRASLTHELPLWGVQIHRINDMALSDTPLPQQKLNKKHGNKFIIDQKLLLAHKWDQKNM